GGAIELERIGGHAPASRAAQLDPARPHERPTLRHQTSIVLSCASTFPEHVTARVVSPKSRPHVDPRNACARPSDVDHGSFTGSRGSAPDPVAGRNGNCSAEAIRRAWDGERADLPT